MTDVIDERVNEDLSVTMILGMKAVNSPKNVSNLKILSNQHSVQLSMKSDVDIMKASSEIITSRKDSDSLIEVNVAQDKIDSKGLHGPQFNSLGQPRSTCRSRAENTRQCQKHIQEIIDKHETRNVELEQREGDLRQRLEMLECSMPAVMVWNIWRMAQGAPASTIHRLVEKQFQGHDPGNAAVANTPSQHYDCRVREVEAERKEALRRAEEARANLAEKEAAVEERRKRLNEAQRRNQERKEKMEKLDREAAELRAALKSVRIDDTSGKGGDCGDIRYKNKWLDGVGSETSVDSMDLECFSKLQELAEAELCMKQQITELEHREEAYMRTLHQADELWCKMETDTVDNVGELREQLNLKSAANQQLADRICQLEDELEKLRKRLIDCTDALLTFTEKEYVETETGFDSAEATVMDQTIVAAIKTTTVSINASVPTVDKETRTFADVSDKESSIIAETMDKGLSVSTKLIDKDTEAIIDRIYREVDRPTGLGVEVSVGNKNDEIECLEDSTTKFDTSQKPKFQVYEANEVNNNDYDEEIPEQWRKWNWNEGCPPNSYCDYFVQSSANMEEVSKGVSRTDSIFQRSSETVAQLLSGDESENVAETAPTVDVQPTDNNSNESKDISIVAESIQLLADDCMTVHKTDTIILSREELRNWYNVVNSIQHTISECVGCSSKIGDTAQLADKMKSHLGIASITDVNGSIIMEDSHPPSIFSTSMAPEIRQDSVLSLSSHSPNVSISTTQKMDEPGLSVVGTGSKIETNIVPFSTEAPTLTSAGVSKILILPIEDTGPQIIKDTNDSENPQITKTLLVSLNPESQEKLANVLERIIISGSESRSTNPQDILDEFLEIAKPQMDSSETQLGVMEQITSAVTGVVSAPVGMADDVAASVTVETERNEETSQFKFISEDKKLSAPIDDVKLPEDEETRLMDMQADNINTSDESSEKIVEETFMKQKSDASAAVLENISSKVQISVNPSNLPSDENLMQDNSDNSEEAEDKTIVVSRHSLEEAEKPISISHELEMEFEELEQSPKRPSQVSTKLSTTKQFVVLETSFLTEEETNGRPLEEISTENHSSKNESLSETNDQMEIIHTSFNEPHSAHVSINKQNIQPISNSNFGISSSDTNDRKETNGIPPPNVEYADTIEDAFSIIDDADLPTISQEIETNKDTMRTESGSKEPSVRITHQESQKLEISVSSSIDDDEATIDSEIKLDIIEQRGSHLQGNMSDEPSAKISLAILSRETMSEVQEIPVIGKPYLSIAKVESLEKPKLVKSVGPCICKPQACTLFSRTLSQEAGLDPSRHSTTNERRSSPPVLRPFQGKLDKLKLQTISEGICLLPEVTMWRRPFGRSRRRKDKSTLTTVCVDTKRDSPLVRDRITLEKIAEKYDCTCFGVDPKNTEVAGGSVERKSPHLRNDKHFIPANHSNAAKQLDFSRLRVHSVSTAEKEIALVKYTENSLSPQVNHLECIECGKPIRSDESLLSEKSPVFTTSEIQKSTTVLFEETKTMVHRESSKDHILTCCECDKSDSIKLKNLLKKKIEIEKILSKMDDCERVSSSLLSDITKKMSVKSSKSKKKKRKPEKKDQSVTAYLPSHKGKTFSSSTKGDSVSKLDSTYENTSLADTIVSGQSLIAEMKALEPAVSCKSKISKGITDKISKEESETNAETLKIQPGKNILTPDRITKCGCGVDSTMHVPYTKYSNIFKTNIVKSESLCRCTFDKSSKMQNIGCYCPSIETVLREKSSCNCAESTK